jgi:hypothetical protein
MGSCQESINHYSVEFEKERETKEGLMKLVEEHGLDRNCWAHMQEE